MKILALDTTQEMCSVALSIGEDIIYREAHAPRSHTQLLLPQVKSVLAEADIQLSALDTLAFGRGPGSFTGLRIAAGVAQGLALGADLPVTPVSSLAAMAQGVYREDESAVNVCATFDARIQEVYWGAYSLRGNIMTSVTEELVSAPDELYLPDDEQWIAVGSGWSAYPQLVSRLSSQLLNVLTERSPLARDIIPIAQSLLADGQVLLAELATPVYLREKVALTVAETQANQA